MGFSVPSVNNAAAFHGLLDSGPIPSWRGFPSAFPPSAGLRLYNADGSVALSTTLRQIQSESEAPLNWSSMYARARWMWEPVDGTALSRQVVRQVTRQSALSVLLQANVAPERAQGLLADSIGQLIPDPSP